MFYGSVCIHLRVDFYFIFSVYAFQSNCKALWIAFDLSESCGINKIGLIYWFCLLNIFVCSLRNEARVDAACTWLQQCARACVVHSGGDGQIQQQKCKTFSMRNTGIALRNALLFTEDRRGLAYNYTWSGGLHLILSFSGKWVKTVGY